MLLHRYALQPEIMGSKIEKDVEKLLDGKNIKMKSYAQEQQKKIRRLEDRIEEVEDEIRNIKDHLSMKNEKKPYYLDLSKLNLT